MAVTVDSVVVELEARLGDYDAKIDRSRRKFDDAMDAEIAAAKKAEAAVAAGAIAKAKAEREAAAAAARAATSQARSARDIAAAKALETKAALATAEAAERSALRQDKVAQRAADRETRTTAALAREKAKQEATAARAADRIAREAERAATREAAAARRAANATARENARKVADAERAAQRQIVVAQRAERAQSVGMVGGAARRVGGVGRELAGAAGVTLGVAGAAVAARTFLQYADESKNLAAQLKLATAESGNFAQAQEDVRRIAQETRSGLADVGSLYATIQRTARESGLTQAEVAGVTETVSKSFKLSGATAAEASGGVRQFLQGLQSGTLRGEELNSVLENAPRLARALADGLGVTIGQLRAMGAEGDLSGEKVTNAILKAKAAIDAEFAQLPKTFTDAMTMVRNAAVITFGAFDRGGEFSTALANFITDGSNGFTDLEKSATDLGIDTRAAFAGLGDAFQPLLDGALRAFGMIDAQSVSTRDRIASLFKVYDDFVNFDTKIENDVRGFSNRNLGTNFKIGGLSDTSGRFTRGFDASASQSRNRINMGFVKNLPMGPGAPPAPPRPASVPKKLTAAQRNANAEVGRDWSATEVADLLRSRGIRVTDVDRSPAQQQAQIDKWDREDPRTRGIRPAGMNGAHVRGKGVDIGREHSIAEIRAVLKEAGVPIGQLINEGDHKHLGIGGKGGGRSSSPEALAAKAERDRVAAEQREQAFQNERADLNNDLLAARRSLLASAEAIEQVELQEIETARAKYADNLVSQVSQKKLTESEAEQLRLVNEQIAVERTKLVERNRQVRLEQEATAAAQRQTELASADLTNARDVLQSQAGAATTAKKLRDSDLRLLDLKYEEEKLRLQAVVNAAERVKNDKNADDEAKAQAANDAEIAKRRLAVLPTLKANAQNDVRQGTMSPGEAYLAGIRSQAQNLDAEFENIAVGGLQSLNDQLADSALKMLGLGSAADSVLGGILKQLLQIAIQQAVIKPLAEAMFGAGSSGIGGSGGGGFGKIAGGIGKAISGLFHPTAGRAGGGAVVAGQLYKVNETGTEGFRPAGAGRIIPMGAMRAASPAAPVGGNTQIIHIDAKGAELGVETKIAAAIQQATPGIAAYARAKDMRARDRRLA